VGKWQGEHAVARKGEAEYATGARAPANLSPP